MKISIIAAAIFGAVAAAPNFANSAPVTNCPFICDAPTLHSRASEITPALLGGWKVGRHVSALDPSLTSASAMLSSTNTVDGLNSTEAVATLVMRCTGGGRGVEVYVAWPFYMEPGEQRVRWRSGPDIVGIESWTVYQSGTAIGPHDGRDSADLIRNLITRRQDSRAFIVEAKPYGSMPEEATFELSGSAAAYVYILDTCLNAGADPS